MRTRPRLTYIALIICGLSVVLASLASLALLASRQLAALPLSYVGGTNIISANSTFGHLFWVSTTVAPNDAIGAEINILPSVDLGLSGWHYTRLMRRWNQTNSQGNAYFHLSSGAAFGLREGLAKTHATPSGRLLGYGKTGFSFDWETRFIYLYYSWEGLFVEQIGQRLVQAARFGFSPLERDYEQVQFWIILELRNRVFSYDSLFTNNAAARAVAKEVTAFTPYFRFFQRNYFFEIGYSDRQTLLLNMLFRL